MVLRVGKDVELMLNVSKCGKIVDWLYFGIFYFRSWVLVCLDFLVNYGSCEGILNKSVKIIFDVRRFGS